MSSPQQESKSKTLDPTALRCDRLQSMPSTVLSLSWIQLEIAYPSKISPNGPLSYHLFLFCFIFVIPLPLSSLHTDFKNKTTCVDWRPYETHLTQSSACFQALNPHHQPPLLLVPPHHVLELLSEWRPPQDTLHSCEGKGQTEDHAQLDSRKSDSDSETWVQEANWLECSGWTPVGGRRKQSGQREKLGCATVTIKVSTNITESSELGHSWSPPTYVLCAPSSAPDSLAGE